MNIKSGKEKVIEGIVIEDNEFPVGMGQKNSGGEIIIKVIQESKDLVFKKPPEAIFMKPVSGELTPLMRKLFNVLSARASMAGPEKSSFIVEIRSLIKDTKYSSRDTAFFKECIKKLNGFQVEWDIFSNGKRQGWGVSTLIAEAEVIGGSLRYSFAPKIQSQLLKPDVYQNISISRTSTFRSGQALALYESCLRYASSPEKMTVNRPWEEWRDMLCSPSVKVKEWKYFRRDTLLPALNEISKLADDIEVEPVVYKSGRIVTGLQFKVKFKQQKNLDLGEDKNIFNTELQSKLINIGFTERESIATLIKYEENRLIAVYEFLEKKIKKGRVESPVAMFKDALKKGYGTTGEGAEPLKKIKLLEIKEPKQSKARAEKSQAIMMYELLSKETQQDVWEEFMSTPGPHISAAKRNGLNSTLAASVFSAWLIREKKV